MDLGCRREPLPGPRRFVGPADPRSPSGAGPDGLACPARTRMDLRRPDRGRAAAGRDGIRADARGRDAPPGQFGNRGRHVRGAARARRHGTSQADQVRGRLPRPCRRLAGRRGVRCRDPRHPGHPGDYRRRRRRHAGCPLQRPGRGRSRHDAMAGTDRRRHRRAGSGKHGRRTTGPRVPRGLAPHAAARFKRTPRPADR